MHGELKMNAGHFEEISDCWSSEDQPTAYYRTTAARARRLQADATTPRVKQYLDKMIVHCEQLAGKVEQPASRPLDRPGCVDQPEGKIRPSPRPISDYRVDPTNGLRPQSDDPSRTRPHHDRTLGICRHGQCATRTSKLAVRMIWLWFR
jgi:hypothetical protein